MSQSKDGIERGLALYRTLLDREPELEDEFVRTRPSFAGAPPGVGDAERVAAKELAARRHLEWFLLERPSEHLGGVPVEVLQEAWLEAAGLPEIELAEAFLCSRAGAFEVTAVDRAQGAWLRDLFGLGEYPVEEPEAAAEIEKGDLLVGRLFPIGEEVFRLSPATSCFRSPALLQAVRCDAERMRDERPGGVLRIEQREIERLFFGPPAGASDGEDPGLRLRELFATGGIADERVEDVLSILRDSARRGDRGAVTEILNGLAFETDLDLESARRVLAEVWGREVRTLGGAGSSPASSPEEGSVDPSAAAAALASFDAGRAEGRDLEELFVQLEKDLGCEGVPDVDAVGEGPIPDFPGAVGAMVQEFLWERDPAGPVPRSARPLDLLADYGRRIGVFENLSARDLLDFAGRWVLEEGRLGGADEARALLADLGAFCRWCDDAHAVSLTEGFGPLLAKLEGDLPRLAEARCHAAADSEGPFLPYQVANVGRDSAELRDEQGEPMRLSVDPRLLEHLREGDLVHARAVEGRALVGRCYPGLLERLRSELR